MTLVRINDPVPQARDERRDTASGTILVVDDDDAVRVRLADGLRHFGHHVEESAGRGETISGIAEDHFGLVLLAIRDAESDKLALLRDLIRRQPRAAIVVSPAHGAVVDAIEGLRAGEYDHLPKPLSLDQLNLLLRSIHERSAVTDAQRLQRHSDGRFVLESSSVAMVRVVKTARRIATFDMPILVTGEIGTGKSVLAAAIHDWSRRRTRAFVTVSCDAPGIHVPERHTRHPPARARASKDDPLWTPNSATGTLFLDEVGALSGALQAELIRFLDEQDSSRGRSGRMRPRVIAATTQDLEAEMRAGRFRHDLLFRLNVVALGLPPLRKRAKDLSALSDQILARLCVRHRRNRIDLAPEARRAFATYSWPGNLRELVTVLEHAVVMSQGPVIQPSDLPARVTA